jgi:hypothetical protein
VGDQPRRGRPADRRLTPVRPRLPLGPPVQLAYVVDDPAAAARRWAEEVGAGPFFLAPHIRVTDVVHRGRPSTFDHTSAYGWWGGLMVELLCQHDDGPSAVHDRFGPGETGLHHVAHLVPSLADALEACSAAGLAVAQSARAGDTTFVFVDALASRGHFLELYEASDRLRGFYAMVQQASLGWDGADPVRPLGG